MHKSNNKIFDRNQDGDFDITNNTSLVSDLYTRKSNTYIENKIYPYATMDDLRADLIDKARKMAVNRVSNHPWGYMNDLELLRSASLYDRDAQTGIEGINLAGILLFGKDETIKSALSYYKTDAILKVRNVDRYDDRDDIRTNLIDSFDRLINFINKHLDDKFYIEDNQRIDVRDKIARELCSNILIHREFSNPYPARLIITKESITTENANKPRNIGYIDLYNYSPYPKNPKIAFVFKEIGLADELGSGIKNIVKYTKIYSGGKPSFRDGDIFKVTVPLIKSINKVKTPKEIKAEARNKLYEFIKNNEGVSRRQINEYMKDILNINNYRELEKNVRYILDFLKKENKIINKSTRKNSKWYSVDEKDIEKNYNKVLKNSEKNSE